MPPMRETSESAVPTTASLPSLIVPTTASFFSAIDSFTAT